MFMEEIAYLVGTRAVASKHLRVLKAFSLCDCLILFETALGTDSVFIFDFDSFTILYECIINLCFEVDFSVDPLKFSFSASRRFIHTIQKIEC